MEKTNEKVPLNGKNERKSSTQWKIALAVTRIEEAGRFGTVEFGTDGGITAFHEKTAGRAGWINGGVYLMERQALASIPEGRCSSLEREWFPLWVAGQHLYAVPTDPPLLDMGTPEGLHTMHQFLSASEMGNRSQCSKELKENDGGGRTVLAKRRGIE